MAETITIRTGAATDVIKVIEAGPQGPAGSNGTNGQGVPVGGTTGQVLRKVSGTNYDTEWAAAAAGSGSQADDYEVTDSTKGIILKSSNNTRWRITIDNNGSLLRTALATLILSALMLCGTKAQVRDLVYGTNNVVVGPTNGVALSFTNSVAFSNITFGTNAATTRTNLGLGWSALTNTDATNFRTAISLASYVTNPIIPLTNGGLGTTNIAVARTNLGLGWSALTNTSFGTATNTFCQGNDARIANIKAGSISNLDGTNGLPGGPSTPGLGGTISMVGGDSYILDGGSAGSISLNGDEQEAQGGSLISDGYLGSSGGTLNMSGGVGNDGGSISTYDGGGSIDTRGTGSIEFGQDGTRTTFVGAATSNITVSLPKSSVTLVGYSTNSALTAQSRTNLGLGSLATNNSVPSGAAATNSILTADGAGGSAFVATLPSLTIGVGTNTDITLQRETTNALSQRNGTNPQTLFLFNTYSNSTNYERGKIAWTNNSLTIGTEKGGGGGSSRTLELHTDGTTRFTITGGGQFVVASGSRMAFGGSSSSFPTLKQSGAVLQVRVADDTAYTTIDAQLRAQGTAPTNSTATGTAGDIRYDTNNFLYLCVSSNTWRRTALTNW
jgi:hypothetical protein